MIEFKALALVNEINLNKLANHFNIKEKLKWEDPLVLTSNHLTGILQVPEDKKTYIFSYGSLVFINCQHHEITDILNYLSKLDKGLLVQAPFTYIDDYSLQSNPETEPAVNYDYMVTHELKDYHPEILAIVLAKSVALERIEYAINLLLDEIESKIDWLEKGRLNLSDRSLAKISSQVLRFKYNTISYLMLLDKPEITWQSEETQDFFTEMSQLFELEDRYQLIRHKSEILLDVTAALTNLTHAKRGTYLEWLIIILISFEIALTLLDKIF